MTSFARGFLVPLLLLAAFAPASRAQKAKADVCPWCKNDPQVMEKAGVVSHGPMPMGSADSAAIVANLPASQWIFLETAHLRWASSLGAENVDLEEQERVRAELARLRAVLPSVPLKVKKLDPWLRLHLIAMKGEEFHARFQKALGVKDADFPLDGSNWNGPYMGAGRMLGEKEKFEVVLHAARATHYAFTKGFTGVQVTGAVRWHFPGVHKMNVSIPCEDPDLKQDHWLFPHIVHNLSHLFFSAYKHFNYDPPMWIDEGLALAMEKEIEPRSTTNEGEEGTFRDDRGPSDYLEAARKMIARGRQKTMADLLYVKEVGAMQNEALVTSWAIVRFLLDEHGEKFQKLLAGVKGQLDEKKMPTGSDLPGLQRKLLKEHFDWTTLALDELWKAWAMKSVPLK